MRIKFNEISSDLSKKHEILQKLNDSQTIYDFDGILHSHKETGTIVASCYRGTKRFIAKLYSYEEPFIHESIILKQLQSRRVPKIYELRSIQDWKIIIMEKFSKDASYILLKNKPINLENFMKKLLKVSPFFFVLLILKLFFLGS